jgi:hypothetical protein
MICFSKALEAMKAGKAAVRDRGKGWCGQEVLMIKPDRREEGLNFYKQTPPTVGMVGVRFYEITNQDVLATNWRIIE